MPGGPCTVHDILWKEDLQFFQTERFVQICTKKQERKKEDAKTAKREGDVMEQKNERSDNVLSEKHKELYIKKSTRIVASYLRRILELSDTPQEVKPFLQVLKEIFVDRKNIRKQESAKAI